MLTPEEDHVLASLRRRPLTTVEALARACGQPAASVARVLSDLEWAGRVVVYRDRVGRPGGVELKDRAAGGWPGGVR